VSIGPAGQQVASNIKRIRESRRLTFVELSERLASVGCAIPVLGLRRIERGERRVDVDDLLAVAAVFGIDAASLWAPPSACESCRGNPPPGFICAACSGLSTA
jgi:transcriptional regulator with XRE-family HTH domain